MKTYKIQLFVECTEEDAISLQKELAQTIHDDFELGSGAVYGVSVKLDTASE